MWKKENQGIKQIQNSKHSKEIHVKKNEILSEEFFYCGELIIKREKK